MFFFFCPLAHRQGFGLYGPQSLCVCRDAPVSVATQNVLLLWTVSFLHLSRSVSWLCKIKNQSVSWSLLALLLHHIYANHIQSSTTDWSFDSSYRKTIGKMNTVLDRIPKGHIWAPLIGYFRNKINEMCKKKFRCTRLIKRAVQNVM